MREQDSIVFKIERETPIALEELTLGMMALGAEYERYIRLKYPKAQEHEADLLVHRVTEKCIWIELVGAMAPIFQGMNNILVFNQFMEMMGEKIQVLSRPGGRLEETTPRELSNLTRMAETIVGDAKGEAALFAMNYDSETEEKRVTARVIYRAKDSRTIIDNAAAQMKQITGAEPNRQDGVLMRLFQTNIGDAAPDRASGERKRNNRINHRCSEAPDLCFGTGRPEDQVCVGVGGYKPVRAGLRR